MLPAVAIAIAVIAVAVLYWRPLRRVHGTLGIRHLIGTGHAFLLLGVVIGLGFGQFEGRLADDLGPITGFVAAWIGFAAGMRFNGRVLRTLPRRAWTTALWPAFGAAIVVGAASFGLLLAVGTPPREALAASLVFGGAAAVSGPTLASVARTRRAGRSTEARSSLRMIELSAGLDDLVLLALTLGAFTLVRGEPEPLAHLGFMALSLFGAVGLGLVTWLFLGGRATQDERLLLGLGMLVFTAGFANWLHLSPATVAAIAAIVLVNLPGERGALLFGAVRRVERSAVVILMIVIGVSLVGELTWVFAPLLVAMVPLRLLAKLWIGDLVARPIPGILGLSARPGWALGLTPQGTLGLMIAVTFYDVWHDPVARVVLAVIATASLINEILGPWLLLRHLREVAVSADRVRRQPADDHPLHDASAPQPGTPEVPR